MKPRALAFFLVLTLSLSGTVPVAWTAESSAESEEAALPPDPAPEKTISLELKNANVLDVLNIISKETGWSIVSGANVQGQVSLFVEDVDPADALETVLEIADLAKIEEKGMIKIITGAEYQKRFGSPYRDFCRMKSFPLKHARAENVATILMNFRSLNGKIVPDPRGNSVTVYDLPRVLQTIDTLIPTLDVDSPTRVFELHYAKATDMETKVRGLLSPDTGVLQVDATNNRMVIADTERKLDQIAAVIHGLDVRPLQVLIEARIVQVTLSDNARFGIDWDMVIKKMGEFNEINFQPDFSVDAPDGGGPLTTLTIDPRRPAGIDAAIDILEEFGKANTISSPRLMVVNDEEANLEVATKQPYVTQSIVQNDSTATTADNVQFIDVGVTMRVKPKIGNDNQIMMKVQPKISRLEADDYDIRAQADGSADYIRSSIPIVTTQLLETSVVIKNGHTLVIGGLIQDSLSKTSAKLPIISDMPVLGAAFRSRSNDMSKSELVIFLTPHIVAPTARTKETSTYFREDGDLLPFDDIGNHAFSKGFSRSQLFWDSKDRPYWLDKPKPGEKIVVGPSEPPVRLKLSLAEIQERTIRDKYAELVREHIWYALKEGQVGLKPGATMDVALEVDRSGKISHIQVLTPKEGVPAGFQDEVAGLIEKTVSLPPLPPEIPGPQEAVAVRYQQLHETSP